MINKERKVSLATLSYVHMYAERYHTTNYINNRHVNKLQPTIIFAYGKSKWNIVCDYSLITIDNFVLQVVTDLCNQLQEIR